MSKLVCKRCVLDSDIPGIEINKESGLCHFCETYVPLSSQEKEQYLNRIEALFKEYSAEAIMMCYMHFQVGKTSIFAL
jgi:hypothetical protein